MYSLEKIVAVLVSRGSAAEISHDVAVSPQEGTVENKCNEQRHSRLIKTVHFSRKKKAVQSSFKNHNELAIKYVCCD